MLDQAHGIGSRIVVTAPALKVLNAQHKRTATIACIEYLKGEYPGAREIIDDLSCFLLDCLGDTADVNAVGILDTLEKTVATALAEAEGAA